ncbi:MAG: DNA mismatch repair endonuclease MutL [Clostridia bacterium]|nr:DNA mismatch repair endonuclease MutL [Clostridia bacterium]
MGDIRLLDNSLINKIAAGEVVERPSSVVKELMENSIDAGADSITVEVKEGGIGLIKITDNGRGIPKDELKTAFLRHATSKLRTLEDLEDILTLGFRGEALSSIASVAQVEMITKTKDSDIGSRIVINGGMVEKEEEAAANDGTVFIMKNLFYNTPARRKFLKKPAAEGGYVSEVVNRIALGHPDIAIKYINNGNTLMQTNGNGDIKSAILYIYGRQMASQMLDVSYSKDGFTVEGLAAKPELSRGNRNYENFFINGRYIKSTVVQNAVEDAYKGKLMTGKFPVFALNLKVPANTVDVNVHPTKLEVRFSDENLIYDIMYNAVTKALKNTELIPSVTWDKPKKLKSDNIQSEIEDIKPEAGIKPENDFKYEDKAISADFSVSENISQSKDESKNPVLSAMSKLYTEESINAGTDVKTNIEVKAETAEIKRPVINKEVKNEETRKPFFNNYRIIGQIFATYWIVEQNNCMYLIDQHAAHERALYEDFIEKFKNSQISSQQLLQPIAVNLSDSEKVIVEENIELLESFGFEIEEFGARTYAVRAVPYVFDSPSNVSFFMDIIDALADKNLKSIYDTKEDAIAMMSCKAAVKGNDRLSYSEAQELIQRLLKLENPFTCPHGRPTIIEMTRYELEKKFKRIQD